MTWADASVREVNKRLIEYMVDTIEPTGWRALWKFDAVCNPPNSPNVKYSNVEYVVDVSWC